MMCAEHQQHLTSPMVNGSGVECAVCVPPSIYLSIYVYNEIGFYDFSDVMHIHKIYFILFNARPSIMLICFEYAV